MYAYALYKEWCKKVIPQTFVFKTEKFVGKQHESLQMLRNS